MPRSFQLGFDTGSQHHRFAGFHLGRCFRVVQEARALAANHPNFMRQAVHLSRSFLRPDDRFESVIFPSSLHATQAFGYWLGHKTKRPKERRLVSFYAVED
jgi:hypothetical protein